MSEREKSDERYYSSEEFTRNMQLDTDANKAKYAKNLEFNSQIR